MNQKEDQGSGRDQEEKKRYLKRYIQIERQIEQKTDELARLRSLAEKITPSLRDSPSTGSQDGCPLERAMEQIIEMERQIDRDIDSMVIIRREVHQTIAAVGCAVYRDVLRLRYINGMTYEQISARTNYSLVHIYRIHKAALDAVVI